MNNVLFVPLLGDQTRMVLNFSMVQNKNIKNTVLEWRVKQMHIVYNVSEEELDFFIIIIIVIIIISHMCLRVH